MKCNVTGNGHGWHGINVINDISINNVYQLIANIGVCLCVTSAGNIAAIVSGVMAVSVSA